MEDERENSNNNNNNNKKGMLKLLDLPEGCLSHILSLTSPLYILRSSLVCKQFCSLAKSDLIWAHFLPSDHFDHPKIISSSSDFPSKKHLVLHLCRSFLLLDGDNKSFSLDKWTGKKCYMLGARELTIDSGANPRCWRWQPLPDSRFPETAELLGVTYLQISGKISTQLLSPNTTYHAYFSFKLRSWSRGFDVCPVKVSVFRVDRTGAYLRDGKSDVPRSFYLKAQESDMSKLNILEDEEAYMTVKDIGDRWLKIDMGKYFNHADSNVAALEMTLTTTDFAFYKSGLIVHGIELLPLD